MRKVEDDCAGNCPPHLWNSGVYRKHGAGQKQRLLHGRGRQLEWILKCHNHYHFGGTCMDYVIESS